jgi:gamma-glutamyl:cysteine ligase YbdK (ATP-grasp superfamily)
MNLFDPRTFSTDWEIMVIDKLERTVNEEKLMAFAAILRRELELPITVDWRTLECALGINTSFAQLRERIENVTTRAAQILADYDLQIYPTGAHPVEQYFNANHIHVGTLCDESAAIRLENALLPYTPAFAALAANSPLSHGRRGEWKSYRVAHKAHGATTPTQLREPHFAQRTWGFDGGVKMHGGPTFEVRITDAASSFHFLSELATFVAAFVHHMGTQPLREVTPDEYRDAMVNRWSAAKHSLQASFHWQGEAISATELLSQMLDECALSLETLGAQRSDFVLLEAMLQKRATQADWVREIAARYPDPWVFASVHAKLARHGNIFDEWLQSAPTLEAIAAPDDEAILQAHLDAIGEGTHFYRSRDAMNFPPPLADSIVETLIEQGRLRRENSPKRGVTLSRIQ